MSWSGNENPIKTDPVRTPIPKGKGVAVLFMMQANGKTSSDMFVEFEEHEDSPWHRANNLRRSCEDDFPGAIWSIGFNERARTLMGNQNMREMGFENYGD